MQEGEANAKRQEAGLPGDAMWAQLAAAVSQQAQQAQVAAQQQAKTNDMLMQLLGAIAHGQQQMAQAINTMAETAAAPKTVTTPEGRTFTAKLG